MNRLVHELGLAGEKCMSLLLIIREYQVSLMYFTMLFVCTTPGKHITQIVGEIQAGASFGELALLHGSRRTATIICKGKDDLNPNAGNPC